MSAPLTRERELALHGCFKIERACTGKQWHRTHADARAAAKWARARYRVSMHSYKCPFCDGWHLTKGTP